MPARWLIRAAMSAVAAALLAPPLLAQPELRFAEAAVVVTEGESATVEVTLTPASDAPVTVEYLSVQGPVPRATPGGACGGAADFVALAVDTLRFEPGVVSQRIPFEACADL